MLVDINPDVEHFDITTKEKLTVKTPYGKFVVPEGFNSDGASAPDFVWWYVPPFGKYLKAAIVHDYLYRTTVYKVDKKTADNVFYWLMKKNKVKKIKAFLMYLGVKWGANQVWEDYKS